MIRRFLAILLILSVVSVFGVAAQDEEIPPIGVGETISGEISNGVIQYNVTAAAGQLLVVDVVSVGFEPSIEVDSVATGREVAFTFGGETAADVYFVAPEAGEYTIKVQDFIDPVTGSYTLRVREGGTLAVGEEASGDIDNAPAPFKFTASAGSLIAARGVIEGLDGRVVISDLEGRELKYASTSYNSSEAVAEYLIPADGEYVVAAGIGVFSDSRVGTYTLSLTEIATTPIAYDTPLDVAIAGTDRAYLSFAATAGDLVHITANAGDTGVDVDLVLVGVDGEDLYSDTSDGIGSNPAITRIMIPADGLYLLKVVPYSGNTASGTVSVSVETAELLTLDAGAVTVTLGDDDRFEQDFIRFTGEPGMSYSLTVTPERNTVSYNISIGEGLFSSINANILNGNSTVLNFTLPADAAAGLVEISLRQSSYQDTATYELTLTPAN